MSTAGLRRREQKQRRRNKRRSERADRSGARSGTWREHVCVEDLIQAVAEAVALDKANADSLVEQLASEPGVIGPLNSVIAHHWGAAQERGWSGDLGKHAARRLGSKYVALLSAPSIDDVRTGIRLLAWLITLPPLPGTTTGKLDPEDARMLERVRGLLSKAESTEYAEEAESLTSKAQELISRHSLQHALQHATQRELPGARHIMLDDPYTDAKALLVDVVASANRCRAVHLQSHGIVTAMGFESDLYATEMLFTSLLVQATKAMTAAGTTSDRRQPSYRRSFLVAFAHRIAERLDVATQKAVAEADDRRLLPVLAQRRSAVDAAVEEAFPNLVSHQMRVTSRQGWASGRVAADLADLAAFDEVR